MVQVPYATVTVKYVRALRIGLVAVAEAVVGPVIEQPNDLNRT